MSSSQATEKESSGSTGKKLDVARVGNEFLMIPVAKLGQWGKAEFRPAFVAAMVRFLDSRPKRETISP